MTRTVTILGAGIAGLAAARKCRELGADPVVFEKQPYSGGHTATYRDESGFIFDDGPHISFTKNERIQQLFSDAVEGRYETIQTRTNNYWQGYWIKHPAQCHLHGLPTDLVGRILRDFVEAEAPEGREIKNYEDWLRAAYGDTFAETFPMEYGLKYHTVPASGMSTEWLGPRFYRPDLEELLNGALGPTETAFHYVSHYRYPTHGGFQSYLQPMIDATRVELSKEVSSIDPQAKRLTFTDGAGADYELLVSSMPLPELIGRIDGAPSDVREAAGNLACTTCVLVNLGIDRADLSDCQWTYFYDREFSVTRASFPHMFSPNVAPKGAGSIQAEVYFSKKYKPLEGAPGDLIEPVIADFKRSGVLRDDDTILFKEARLVPYANVIFDLDRAQALETVRGYLDDVGIHTCGRYGEWGYQWTDESFLSGESAAESAISKGS